MNDKNKKFGQQIKELRHQRGFSVRQTALQAQMSNSYLSQIENGLVNIPKPITLEKLAKGLRVPVGEIFQMAGLQSQQSEFKAYDSHPLVSIPVLGEIACGTPIIAQENIEDYLPTPKAGLPMGTNFYLKCRGESMAPTIPNGAFVLIHQQFQVENGDIAAILLNENETTLKRVQYQDDQVILMPDNPSPEFQPIIINRHNPGQIIGKAIQVQFKL
ncbi:helix-turn-helix domain-containing protein [Fructilactobacillus hinvesii]|uniref:Helix-turn-helix domain-containing protein n=1 Tax=Fructilactobacillus hinvesii TaxID=2940300 RepID=A0ABY5BUH0_9LACO|nr:S24 family peptidase [Fructilactobacillus hinvesii]USS87313.1 helix-turn-helix domain-containing protein [Fructilactobacillus hinvesii]